MSTEKQGQYGSSRFGYETACSLALTKPANGGICGVGIVRRVESTEKSGLGMPLKLLRSLRA